MSEPAGRTIRNPDEAHQRFLVPRARGGRGRPDRRERAQLGDVPRVDRVAVGDASAGRVAGCRIAGEEVEGTAFVRGLPLPVGAREDGEVRSGETAGDDRRVQ